MTQQLSTQARRFAHYMLNHGAKIEDIADTLGVPRRLVVRCLRQRRLLANAAVKEAWKRWQAGVKVDIESLVLWDKPGPLAADKLWTENEKIALAELAGTQSIDRLARRFKRSRRAVSIQINRQGLAQQAYSHSQRGLASALNIDRRLVCLWCTKELVRCYQDGPRKMVHREDAEELLLYFYEMNWHETGIPKHPGAARRRAGYDQQGGPQVVQP